MKIRWLLLLVLILSACISDVPETEQQTESPIQTQAPETEIPVTEEPVETEVPVTTELPPTEPPPTEEPVCAKLLTPADGLEVPAVGKVTFSWKPIEGADSYILRFTLPSGNIVEFETDEAAKDRYMEAFEMGGEFEWNVIVYNLNGDEICISESALFTKPALNSSNGDEKDGNNGNLGEGPPGGGE